MTTYITPLQKLRFTDLAGIPLVGGKLFTYDAGTTNKRATYTNSTGATPNQNPIVLDARGECNCWLTQGVSYKFTLAPATDSDPPSNPIWTVDNISGVGDFTAAQASILAQLAASTPPTGASLIGYKSPLVGAIASTVQRKLDSLVIDGLIDFGMVGDGLTDNTAAFQAALNAVPATGGVVRIPPGSYVSQSVIPKANTLILLDSGAQLLAKHGAANQLFFFTNSIVQTTNLTTGLSGAFQVTVANTAGFAAGHRVIVSAGTFTGSGVEEGPIEFNTVVSVDDGTHLTLQSPLQYSYSAFGIPGAAPRVKSLGAESTMVRNVRITGGTIKPFAGFDSIYFNFACVENIEIDNVFFDGVGAGLATGHQLSHFNFHDNVVSGSALVVGGQAFDIATVSESFFINNVLALRNDADPNGQFNHIVLEVACRDNIVQGNCIGPLRSTATGGIDFTFYSFNNRIENNTLWGVDTDVQASKATLGIRTIANGSGIGGGNVIIGNKIRNVMQGIGDNQPGSIIALNVHENDTLIATSVGINVGSDSNVSAMWGNSFKNVNFLARSNSGTIAGFGAFSGTTTPTAAGSGTGFGTVGSMYLKKNGAAGQGAWFLEPEGGGTWLPRNQLPTVLFAAVGTPANGTMLYVSDGTAGNPLTGAGPGCFAFRDGGVWKGLTLP